MHRCCSPSINCQSSWAQARSTVRRSGGQRSGVSQHGRHHLIPLSGCQTMCAFHPVLCMSLAPPVHAHVTLVTAQFGILILASSAVASFVILTGEAGTAACVSCPS
jgi:hypothetical protein